MSEKDWIAIIGSREPKYNQVSAVIEFIKSIDKDTKKIVSGCAYGIDAMALMTAFKLGFETIGILPWNNYNRDVQQFCTGVVCVDDFEEKDRDAAYASVYANHPAPERLTQGAMKLHARNYGIIYWSSLVIACPSNKPGGGGTGQGIRLANKLGINTTIINPE